jgi:hypothetical protein
MSSGTGLMSSGTAIIDEETSIKEWTYNLNQ